MIVLYMMCSTIMYGKCSITICKKCKVTKKILLLQNLVDAFFQGFLKEFGVSDFGLESGEGGSGGDEDQVPGGARRRPEERGGGQGEGLRSVRTENREFVEDPFFGSKRQELGDPSDRNEDDIEERNYRISESIEQDTGESAEE